MENIFEGINLEDLEAGNLEGIQVNEVSGERTETPNNENKENITIEEVGFPIEVIADLTEIPNEEDLEKINKTPEATESSLSSKSMLNSLTSALVEEGVLSSLSKEELEEIKGTEDLLKAIAKQIKENEYSDLNKEQKEYLEAVRSGVNTREFLERKSVLEQYKAVTEEMINENENLQFELIKRSFLIKGFTDKEAIKYAKSAINTEDPVEEATNALNSLVAHEEKVLQETVEVEKAKKQAELEKEEQKIKELKSKVNSAADLIPGYKINSITKEKVFDSITSIVKTEGGNNYNEVMDSYKNDLDYKLRLHALHVATKGFTDFSKFEKTTKTKAVSELKEKLEGYSTSSGVAPKINRGVATVGILEALKNANF